MDGLAPSPRLHTTYIDVEPLSGVGFAAHKRIQISFPMEATPHVSLLHEVY